MAKAKLIGEVIDLPHGGHAARIYRYPSGRKLPETRLLLTGDATPFATRMAALDALNSYRLAPREVKQLTTPTPKPTPAPKRAPAPKRRPHQTVSQPYTNRLNPRDPASFDMLVEDHGLLTACRLRVNAQRAFIALHSASDARLRDWRHREQQLLLEWQLALDEAKQEADNQKFLARMSQYDLTLGEG